MHVASESVLRKDCAKLQTYFDIHNFFVPDALFFCKNVANPKIFYIFAI